MYLYFGYLSIQFLVVINKLLQENISISAILFSVAVVFVWAFLPFMGYLLAKLLKAKGRASKYVLFSFGAGIGLVEYSLFYFDILLNKQNTISTVIVFFLFFIIAYISTNKTEFIVQN